MERPKKDFDTVLEECYKEETMYIDPEFPCANKSLCPPNEWNTKTWACMIEWIRASRLPSYTDEEGDTQLIADQGEGVIVPGQVMAGELRDNHFLSVLGCLAENNQQKIKNMFLDNGSALYGFYAVNYYSVGV